MGLHRAQHLPIDYLGRLPPQEQRWPSPNRTKARAQSTS